MVFWGGPVVSESREKCLWGSIHSDRSDQFDDPHWIDKRGRTTVTIFAGVLVIYVGDALNVCDVPRLCIQIVTSAWYYFVLPLFRWFHLLSVDPIED